MDRVLRPKVLSRLTVAVFAVGLGACGGGGGGGSGKAGQQGAAGVPSTKGIAGGLPGSLFYAEQYKTLRVEVDTGFVEYVSPRLKKPWFSPDGENLVWHTDDDDQYVLYVGKSDGRLLTSLRLGFTLFSQSKLSPDKQMVAVGYEFANGTRGVAIYRVSDWKLIRNFEDSADRIHNTFDWMPDGSFVFTVNHGFFKLDIVGTGGLINGQPALITDLGGGSPTRLSLSHDGSKMAFDMVADDGYRHLFTMSIDGSGLSQLTDSYQDSEYEATWSPDGNAIAFRHGDAWLGCQIGLTSSLCYGDCPDVLIVPAEAVKIKVAEGVRSSDVIYPRALHEDKLIGLICPEEAPSWTRNPSVPAAEFGKMRDYKQFNLGLGGSLYSVTREGRPTAVDLKTGQHALLPWFEEQGMAVPYFARESGEMFSLQSSPRYHQNAHQVVVRKPNGDEVTSFLLPKSENTGVPIPSPDGKRIAISRMLPNADGNTEQVITIFNRDRITDASQEFAGFHRAAWLPDGRLLLTKAGEVFISFDPLDDSTSSDDMQRVTDLGAFIYDVAVSPDGTRLAVSMLNRVYTVNIDGSKLTQLTASDGPVFNPMWSADGGYILVRKTILSTLNSVFAIPSDAVRAFVGFKTIVPTSAVLLKDHRGRVIESDYQVQWFEAL
ncbi:TolB family protein [Allohahella sp. A8]|uniref:TolB family protein n=1 Tax=Allohahella sp. A8 TaxID=3141461 RepID=UPI003A812279